MATEHFNIFIDNDETGKVTARVFQKHYKGLVCHTTEYDNPEDALNKIRSACHEALDRDFNERRAKLLKYIALAEKENEVKAPDLSKEYLQVQPDRAIIKEEYEECMACQ